MKKVCFNDSGGWPGKRFLLSQHWLNLGLVTSRNRKMYKNFMFSLEKDFFNNQNIVYNIFYMLLYALLLWEHSKKTRKNRGNVRNTNPYPWSKILTIVLYFKTACWVKKAHKLLRTVVINPTLLPECPFFFFFFYVLLPNYY